MRRTTVFLDAALLKRAQRHARQAGTSFATLVREALHAYLSGTTPTPGRVPRIAGQFASNRADTADRVDELLWKDPHS